MGEDFIADRTVHRQAFAGFHCGDDQRRPVLIIAFLAVRHSCQSTLEVFLQLQNTRIGFNRLPLLLFVLLHADLGSLVFEEFEIGQASRTDRPAVSPSSIEREARSAREWNHQSKYDHAPGRP